MNRSAEHAEMLLRRAADDAQMLGCLIDDPASIEWAQSVIAGR